MANRLFEAGCDDSIAGSSHGVVQIGFDREAETMEAAVTSAIKQVQTAGYKIKRVEFDQDAVLSLTAG